MGNLANGSGERVAKLLVQLWDADADRRVSAAQALSDLGQPKWQQWVQGDSADFSRLRWLADEPDLAPLIQDGRVPLSHLKPLQSAYCQRALVLRSFWRERAKAWWRSSGRSQAQCDSGGERIPPEEGYLTGSNLRCQECADRYLQAIDWARAFGNEEKWFRTEEIDALRKVDEYEESWPDPEEAEGLLLVIGRIESLGGGRALLSGSRRSLFAWSESIRGPQPSIGSEVEIAGRHRVQKARIAECRTEQDPVTFVVEGVSPEFIEVADLLRYPAPQKDPAAQKEDQKKKLNLALSTAAFDGETSTVRRLLAAGADVNETRNDGGWTPLHSAAARYPQLADMLLAHGADVHARANNGCTPLHFTAYHGHTRVAQLLLERGADVNGHSDAPRLYCSDGGLEAWDETDDGCTETPLYSAVAIGYTELVKLLLDNGADCNIQNEDGMSARDKAMATGHTDIVELLQRAGAVAERKQPQGEEAKQQAEEEGRRQEDDKRRHEAHTKRRAQDQGREKIGARRKATGQCVLCGQPLGFLLRLRGRDRHKYCTTFKE